MEENLSQIETTQPKKEKKKFSPKTIKRLKIVLAVFVVIFAFIGGVLTQYLLNGNNSNTLSWIAQMVDKYYYCEEDGVIKQFTESDYANAIVDVLLDNYSDYYTNDEYKDVLSTDKGNEFGTGLTFLKADNTPTVFRVIGNSPSERVGVRSGDLLTAIELAGQDKVVFTDKDHALSSLSSLPQNTEFTLYFERNGEERSVVLAKQVFVISYVKYYDNEQFAHFTGDNANVLTVDNSDEFDYIGDDTAYISLDEFSGNAATQLKTALSYMKQRSKTKLIFDLRDNGGGKMDILKEIASCFISSPNPVICQVKYKDGKVEVFKADGNNFNTSISKITLLANQRTASASECLIGAMLYHGTAFSQSNLIIEKVDGVAKTFGKGIMQTTYQNLLTGDALKLTTAKIYLPDGVTSIHGVGFFPNAENATEVGRSAVERAVEILG